MDLTGFVLVPFLILLTIGGCVGRPLPSKLHDSDKQPLQTSRPYNIAHRGANGEFPEETTAAYMVCLLSTCSLILRVHLYKLLENGVLGLKLAFVEKLGVMVAKTEFWVLKNALLSS